jgi:hypothetical protein
MHAQQQQYNIASMLCVVVVLIHADTSFELSHVTCKRLQVSSGCVMFAPLFLCQGVVLWFLTAADGE